ncbi:MAG: glycosyltransferase family 2 protein, partial [Bacteroides sp.]
YFWKAFYSSNWDFCDKMLQQVLIPRLLLLGFVPACSLLVSLYSWQWGIKWCFLFVLLAMALFVAIPKRFYTSRLVTAFQKLPYTFWLMFLSVFKLKGANKTFIHTRHGVVDSNR